MRGCLTNCALHHAAASQKVYCAFFFFFLLFFQGREKKNKIFYSIAMNKVTERRPLAAQSASLYWPRPENIQAQIYSNILTVYNSLSLCCLPILSSSYISFSYTLAKVVWLGKGPVDDLICIMKASLEPFRRLQFSH